MDTRAAVTSGNTTPGVMGHQGEGTVAGFQGHIHVRQVEDDGAVHVEGSE